MSAFDFNFVTNLTHQRDDEYFFVVDNTQDYVSLQENAQNHYMASGEGKTVFPQGENFNILSWGVKLPLAFEFWEQVNPAQKFVPISVNPIIEYEDTSAYTIFPNAQNLIFSNYEQSWNSFVRNPAAKNGSFRFRWHFNGQNDLPRISMFGVDEALNGKRFHCYIFVKVQHNLTMRTV